MPPKNIPFTTQPNSDILGETFNKVKVTTSVMRTMKKFGGLDGYLLNTPERKLADSDFGRRLQRRIKEHVKLNPGVLAEVAQAKLEAEAAAESKRRELFEMKQRGEVPAAKEIPDTATFDIFGRRTS